MEPLSSLLRNRFALALAGSAALHAAALLAPAPAQPRATLPSVPLSIRLLPSPAPQPAEPPPAPAPAAPAPSPEAPKPLPKTLSKPPEPRRLNKALPHSSSGPVVASTPNPEPSSALAAPRAPAEEALSAKPSEGPASAPVSKAHAKAASGSGDAKASPLSYYSKGSVPYPPEALRRGQEGTAVLLVEVAADGSVRSAKVSSSSGYSSLDQAAVAAVLGWKFNPAKSGGVPVDGHAFVPVVFKAPDY